jgi:hypothetical protein
MLATEDALLQYIQPKLRNLYAVCGPLSNDFFYSLPEVCLSLQDMTLRPKEVAASDSSLLRALANMKNVKTRTLEAGF